MQSADDRALTTTDESSDGMDRGAPTSSSRRMQPIDDPNDPRLDRFRDLIARGDRLGPDDFFAESELAVARLLASPHFKTRLVLGTPAHLARLDIPSNCEALAVSRATLRTVLGFDLHRGVIACGIRPPALVPDLSPGACPIGPVLGADSLAALLARPTFTALLVQGLADPANLGSILHLPTLRCRICDAAAVRQASGVGAGVLPEAQRGDGEGDRQAQGAVPAPA